MGFQAFYYVYYSILKHVDVADSVCVTHQPFEYDVPKDITQRSWYSYNNEVKRIE